MAILKEKVELKEGSAVTPQLINDTVETSLDAHRKSVEAKSQSDIALKKSVEAELHSEKSERRVSKHKRKCRRTELFFMLFSAVSTPQILLDRF